MDLEGSKPQISKLGHAAKMGPRSQFLQFFHLESAKTNEKLYNDLIQIIPPHFGRILVTKIFY
jgi:hypothetical protein